MWSYSPLQNLQKNKFCFSHGVLIHPPSTIVLKNLFIFLLTSIQPESAFLGSELMFLYVFAGRKGSRFFLVIVLPTHTNTASRCCLSVSILLLNGPNVTHCVTHDKTQSTAFHTCTNTHSLTQTQTRYHIPSLVVCHYNSRWLTSFSCL